MQGINLLNELKNNLKTQGDTFLTLNGCLEGGIQYWKKGLKY